MKRMHIYLIVSLVFALLVAFFAVQNVEPVSVAFLFWNVEISLVLVILGSMFFGVLVTSLFDLFQRTRKGIDHKTLVKQVDQLASDNDGLKKALEEQRLLAEQNKGASAAAASTGAANTGAVNYGAVNTGPGASKPVGPGSASDKQATSGYYGNQ